MKKYESLTRYIELFQGDSFGEWVKDPHADNAPDNVIYLSHLLYSDNVSRFVSDFYRFANENRELGLNRYRTILEENGVEYSIKADCSSLNARCVLALIMTAIRGDRFCEGALLDALESSAVSRWLERLREIDNLSQTKTTGGSTE